MKYSLLLRNGRILDPVNGVDMVGDIGLDGATIAEVGNELPAADAGQIIDVRGKWIIPGVIDPHMHVSDWIGGPPGFKMMAREGVVTALDMAGPVGSVIDNVGAYGSGMNIACINAVAITTPTENQQNLSLEEVPKRMESLMANGAFGIKLLGGHYPLSPEVTREVIHYAAKRHWYVAFHAGTTAHGSNLEGLQEALELADGAPIHIPHINSYCRGQIKPPLVEASEALDLLMHNPNAWSESYLSVYNGTSGQCRDGEILSQVTKRCCRIRGYDDNEKGLGEAIKGGYCHVVMYEGGENHRVTGDRGHEYWVARKTDVTVSFPVNVSSVQVSVACMKDEKGEFIVDALSTDGGGIPRNTMVRQGLDLVRFGALTPAEFVQKSSTKAAAMLGLKGKGHLSPGADGDITVIDPEKSKAHMGISGGKIIMLDGVVLGSRGTIITSREGEARVKESGLDYVVVDGKDVLRRKN
jgi:hypothetical protein